MRRALLADQVVRRTLPEGKSPASLAALTPTLTEQTVKAGDCGYQVPPNFLTGFAIYDWQRGNAAVHIGLPHAEEVCRGQMTQLGLLVSAPEALAAELTEAKAGRAGVLMKDLQRIAGQAVTEFSFSQRGK